VTVDCKKILAVIRFPEGTAEEDIDIGQPLVLYPGDSLNGIEAINGLLHGTGVEPYASAYLHPFPRTR